MTTAAPIAIAFVESAPMGVWTVFTLDSSRRIASRPLSPALVICRPAPAAFDAAISPRRWAARLDPVLDVLLQGAAHR